MRALFSGLVAMGPLAALAQLLPPAPLYLLTNRGTDRGVWTRDPDFKDLRLFQVKEELEFPANQPPRVGEKVADVFPVAILPDAAAQSLLTAAQNAGQTRNALLVFYIHGYNNDVVSALDTAWLFRRDFAEPALAPVVCSIAWPSDKNMLRYNQDKADAVRSGEAVGRFLKSLGDERPPITEGLRIVVVTHSMGAVVVSQAADWIAKNSQIRRPLIDEIIMVAPDLARSEFDRNRFGGVLGKISRHVTVYFSVNDTVLTGSGLLRLSTGGRLGSQGPLDYTRLPLNSTVVNASRDVKSGRRGILGPIETHGIYWQNLTFMTDFSALVKGRPATPGFREQINDRLWKLVRPDKEAAPDSI